jgi:hypothetical protein
LFHLVPGADAGGGVAGAGLMPPVLLALSAPALAGGIRTRDDDNIYYIVYYMYYTISHLFIRYRMYVQYRIQYLIRYCIEYRI